MNVRSFVHNAFMHNTFAACAAALVVAVAGCGTGGARNSNDRSADPVEQAQALPDPCSLLTKEELAQQLEPWIDEQKSQKGLRAKVSTEPITNGAWPDCLVSWQVVDADGQTIDHDESQMVHVMTSEQWKDQLKDMQSVQGKAPTLEPIAGVGNEAFYLGNRVFARVGSTYVAVVFPKREGALALLRTAVTRVH
jgi:hypothetical protein